MTLTLTLMLMLTQTLIPLLSQAGEVAGDVAQTVPDFSLTAGGWTIMILSVGFVTTLLTWCIYKVVTTPGETEHLHGPTDIEPPDLAQR